MARLTLLAICLTILFALNFVFSWDGFAASMETSNKNQYPEDSNNIQSSGSNSIAQNADQIDAIIESNNDLIGSVQAIPSYYSSYFPTSQPRITTASSQVTITYKLGRRINGKK